MDQQRPQFLNYETPAFPSLYGQPINPAPGQATFLLYTRDIWRFTLYWNLIFFLAVHLAVALYAVIILRRNWKVVVFVPVTFALLSGLECVIAGSIVGLM